MADNIVYATVLTINPTLDATEIVFNIIQQPFGGDGGTASYVLQYDHPGYSSIYTLLVASGVNQKHLDLSVNSVDGKTIEQAMYRFV
jgi:hypothetical protein